MRFIRAAFATRDPSVIDIWAHSELFVFDSPIVSKREGDSAVVEEEVYALRRVVAVVSHKTWGICTRRAGKLDRDGYRLYQSQLLQENMRWT